MNNKENNANVESQENVKNHDLEKQEVAKATFGKVVLILKAIGTKIWEGITAAVGIAIRNILFTSYEKERLTDQFNKETAAKQQKINDQSNIKPNLENENQIKETSALENENQTKETQTLENEEKTKDIPTPEKETVKEAFDSIFNKDNIKAMLNDAAIQQVFANSNMAPFYDQKKDMIYLYQKEPCVKIDYAVNGSEVFSGKCSSFHSVLYNSMKNDRMSAAQKNDVKLEAAIMATVITAAMKLKLNEQLGNDSLDSALAKTTCYIGAKEQRLKLEIKLDPKNQNNLVLYNNEKKLCTLKIADILNKSIVEYKAGIKDKILNEWEKNKNIDRKIMIGEGKNKLTFSLQNDGRLMVTNGREKIGEYKFIYEQDVRKLIKDINNKGLKLEHNGNALDVEAIAYTAGALTNPDMKFNRDSSGAYMNTFTSEVVSDMAAYLDVRSEGNQVIITGNYIKEPSFEKIKDLEKLTNKELKILFEDESLPSMKYKDLINKLSEDKEIMINTNNANYKISRDLENNICLYKQHLERMEDLEFEKINITNEFTNINFDNMSTDKFINIVKNISEFKEQHNMLGFEGYENYSREREVSGRADYMIDKEIVKIQKVNVQDLENIVKQHMNEDKIAGRERWNPLDHLNKYSADEHEFVRNGHTQNNQRKQEETPNYVEREL